MPLPRDAFWGGGGSWLSRPLCPAHGATGGVLRGPPPPCLPMHCQRKALSSSEIGEGALGHGLPLLYIYIHGQVQGKLIHASLLPFSPSRQTREAEEGRRLWSADPGFSSLAGGARLEDLGLLGCGSVPGALSQTQRWGH